MWACKDCGGVFSEPIQYNPENVDCISDQDYDLWCDYENEEVCPHCYSMNIISIVEDEWE